MEHGGKVFVSFYFSLEYFPDCALGLIHVRSRDPTLTMALFGLEIPVFFWGWNLTYAAK